MLLGSNWGLSPCLVVGDILGIGDLSKSYFLVGIMFTCHVVTVEFSMITFLEPWVA